MILWVVHLSCSLATTRNMCRPMVVVVVLVDLQMMALGWMLGMVVMGMMAALLSRDQSVEAPTAVGAAHVAVEIVLLLLLLTVGGMVTSGQRRRNGMRVMQVRRFAIG